MWPRFIGIALVAAAAMPARPSVGLRRTDPKINLRFARDTARFRYSIREQYTPGSQGTREASLVWMLWETIVYVTEETHDSSQIHQVRVRVDSNRGGSGGAVALGPFPGFTAMFNDRREWVDTTASPDSLTDVFRNVVFNAMVPLPAAPVGVGDSWTSESPHQITHFLKPLQDQRTSSRCKVKAIRVVDGDTLVDIDVSIRLRALFTPKGFDNPVDLRGDVKGRETFSTSRGATLHSMLEGRIEWEVSMSTPRGYVPEDFAVNQTLERTLLP